MSKTQLILAIIQAALAGLAIVPGGAIPAAGAEAFIQILTSGMALYQQEVGQPLDVTKIPLETAVQ